MSEGAWEFHKVLYIGSLLAAYFALTFSVMVASKLAHKAEIQIKTQKPVTYCSILDIINILAPLRNLL